MLLIVKTPFNGQEEIMDMHVIHYFLAAAREEISQRQRSVSI